MEREILTCSTEIQRYFQIDEINPIFFSIPKTSRDSKSFHCIASPFGVVLHGCEKFVLDLSMSLPSWTSHATLANLSTTKRTLLARTWHRYHWNKIWHRPLTFLSRAIKKGACPKLVEGLLDIPWRSEYMLRTRVELCFLQGLPEP